MRIRNLNAGGRVVDDQVHETFRHLKHRFSLIFGLHPVYFETAIRRAAIDRFQPNDELELFA